MNLLYKYYKLQFLGKARFFIPALNIHEFVRRARALSDKTFIPAHYFPTI